MTDDEKIAQPKKKCECGDIKYGYTRGKAKFYICYKCGAYNGVNFNQRIYMTLLEDPSILLHLLKTGYLKPMR